MLLQGKRSVPLYSLQRPHQRHVRPLAGSSGWQTGWQSPAVALQVVALLEAHDLWPQYLVPRPEVNTRRITLVVLARSLATCPTHLLCVTRDTDTPFSENPHML